MKKMLLALVLSGLVLNADELVNLKIDGMTCPACVKNVKSSLSEVEGVKESNVYLKTGKAEVKAAPGAKSDAMCDAVKKAGYGCKVIK